MAEDRAALDDLAAAVADGADVDWAALTARAGTPQDQARIARFALLARIAGVHAAASDDDGAGAASAGGFAPLPPYVPGDHWGPLCIVELLASGTFGTVYRAHDPTLARDVALKILHVPASGERLAVDAVTEGRLLARVRHPHVVSVYGADQYDGRVGLWMELIEGRTLEAELEARGPLPVEEVLAVGTDLAQALHAVHAAGLLHRDLKTQNVMREARDGRVVLMDFSAGRDQFDVSQQSPSLPVTIAGSPLYLAPECFEGQPASTRSDIYGLGVVLYRLATGGFPVDGAGLADIAAAHRARAGKQGPHLVAVPAVFASTLGRMLAADQMHRLATAAEVETALRSASHPSRSGRGTRRAWAAAMVVPVLVGVMAIVSWSISGTPAPTRPAEAARVTPTTTSAEARDLFERSEAAMLASQDLPVDVMQEQTTRADAWLARAVELDPVFASAWILRATAASRLGRPAPEYLALAEHALTLVAPVTPAERAFIEAVARLMRADTAPGRRDELQSAARACEDLLRLVPNHNWALRQLPLIYERLQRPDDAERVQMRAVEVYPTSLPIAQAAARVYLRRRDRDSLRRVATTALASVTPATSQQLSGASFPMSWLVLWDARDAWMAGDAARMLEALREVERAHGMSSNRLVHLALTYAYQSLGRFDDARAAADRIADPGEREFARTGTDARQERWTDVKAVIAPGGRVPTVPSKHHYMYLFAGMLGEAERHVTWLRTNLTGAGWLAAQEFEAHLRVAQGRHREALGLFAPLLIDERGPRLRMQEGVATARRGTGDVQGAISLLERFEREPILVHVGGFAGFDWLRCMTLLAELYQQQGRTTESARVAAKVRAMLAHADAEHPFRARLERLP